MTNFINKNVSFEKIFLNFKINYKFQKISFSIKSTKSTFRKKIFCKKKFFENTKYLFLNNKDKKTYF